MRLPIANTTTPGNTSAAVAAGNTVRRNICIRIIHKTATAPMDQPMLVRSPATDTGALWRSNGSSRYSYASAPTVNVTSTVSSTSSGSAARAGCPRTSVTTPTIRHT